MTAPRAGGPGGENASDSEGGTAAAGRLGVGVLDGEAAARHVVDKVDLGTLQVAHADGIDIEADAIRLDDLVDVGGTFAFLDHEAILEAGTPAALHEDAQPGVGPALFGEQLGNLLGSRAGDGDHGCDVSHRTFRQV